MKIEFRWIDSDEFYALHSIMYIVTELHHDDTNAELARKKRIRKKVDKAVGNEIVENRNIKIFIKNHNKTPSAFLDELLTKRAKADNYNRRN